MKMLRDWKYLFLAPSTWIVLALVVFGLLWHLANVTAANGASAASARWSQVLGAN